MRVIKYSLRLGWVAAFALIATAFSGLAEPAETNKTATSDGPPARIRVLTREIVVQPDGSATITVHSEVQILKEAIISSLSQTPLSYVDSLQDLEIESAYTLKGDGKKLPVAPNAIMTQQAPRTASLPFYTDLKQKIIVFPQVEVGDTLVFTAITRSRPIIPGQFVFDMVIPPALIIDRSYTTVAAPEAFPLNFDAKHLTVKTAKNAGTVTYTVNYSSSNAVPDDNQPISRFDRGPRFSVSSFKSFDDLANVYAAFVEPKIVVTAAIQQKADEVTAGAHGHDEQARKIYDWVSTHIRYVAIEFGVGSIVPHDADSVLSNGYGDCKDHAVLFAALLKAKGIQGNLVLINSSNTYSVAQVPTLGAFNHALTWLPEIGIYADTTSRTAPFGSLPRNEYGKPVLVIADKTGALRRTPLLVPTDSTVTYVAKEQLDDAAHLTASNVTMGTGAFAGVLRGVGLVIQADNNNKFAGIVLKAHGMPRATGKFEASSTTELADNYSIDGSYSMPGEWRHVLQDEPFRLPDGLDFVIPTGGEFLGPIADPKYAAADSVPCYSGRWIEEYSLEFPEKFRLASLPSDFAVKTAHLDYTSHWSIDAHTVEVRREFVARFDEPLCSRNVISETQGALAQIGKEYAAQITLSSTQPQTGSP